MPVRDILAISDRDRPETTIALTEFDTYNRFRALAARGDDLRSVEDHRARGLALLDQLDARSASINNLSDT